MHTPPLSGMVMPPESNNPFIFHNLPHLENAVNIFSRNKETILTTIGHKKASNHCLTMI
jgi:hypothetical protein